MSPVAPTANAAAPVKYRKGTAANTPTTMQVPTGVCSVGLTLL